MSHSDPPSPPWVVRWGLRCFWLVSLLGLATFEAAAQVPMALTIGEAIRDKSDDSPVHLGETLVLTGVVTDDAHDVGSGSSLANIQDPTGGIVLFGDYKAIPPGSLKRGDTVQAIGKLSQYRGMEELLVGSVRKTGTAKLPEPIDVPAAQLHGEQYAGRLVRVTGQLVLQPNGGVALRDRSGDIPVYLLRSFFQNTSFMKRLLQGGRVDIVGLARQRVGDHEPPNSGYLLSPRDEQDFKFPPLARYREISLGALIVLGSFLYLWTRRSAAEKRAQALAILSEGLKESDDRFRQMAASIDQAFWMLDVNRNQLLYVSPAFEKIWGRPLSILDDRQNLLDTIHSDDRERMAAFMDRNTHQACEETYRILRPDGAVRWIHDRAFPIFDENGKLYRVTGIAADITEQRDLEEQLRQAQKMDAVGRLAGGVAHDFNNLLTVIGGYAQTLLDRTPANDPRHSPLEQILTASNRAAALTSQLLAFSRKQMLQPKLINVNNLVANMETLLTRVMGEHITFRAEFSKEPVHVIADPNQLEQVLINLAANARDAMPEGGEFRIETAIVDAPDLDFKEEKCVCLKVTDTGIGMHPNVLEHAFEPFFTTKGVGKGTGLGLSTVYGIVQQNHGAIHASSEPGRGTVFEIYLPAAPPAEEPAEAPERTATLKGNETILVAEDEPEVRRLVRDALEQLGYTVLQAADGYEALRILEQHREPVHLLLTDVIMPLMSGRELARRVQSVRPSTRVVYMSGYTDDTLAFHGFPQPDTGFIQKPFTVTLLAEQVRRMLSEDHK
jgi:PAS domain S-box-containing protein